MGVEDWVVCTAAIHWRSCGRGREPPSTALFAKNRRRVYQSLGNLFRDEFWLWYFDLQRDFPSISPSWMSRYESSIHRHASHQ